MCSSTAVHTALSGIKPAIEQAVAEQLRDLATLSIVNLASPTWSADLAGADYWVVQLGQYDANLIDSSPALKGIITCSMGFDHIDLAAATRHNVPVVNTPEFAVSVAEAALTLILAATKHFPAMQRAVSRGTWPVQAHERGMTLSGKALGIIGLGNIGVHVARYGRALQMTVLAADPYLTLECAAERGTDELVELGELLARSDVVLLSCPLNDSTFHLIDGAALSQMKPTAFLINIGRGKLVDEPALVEALGRGEIAGAGLDVLEQEPPDPDSPLLTMPNVIVTPHSLGATAENPAIIATAVRRVIESLLRGERPAHTLNL